MEAGILSLKEKPQEDKLPHYSSYHAMGILLALVGMSAQWSFLHSITFLGSVIGVQSEVEPGSAWIANSLGTFTVFLLIFALSRRITPLLEKRALYPAAALCLVGGIALLLVGNLLFSSPACNYAGNVLVACGATPLIIMWGELYKYLDPKGEQLLVTLSAATLAVVAYLVEILLPAPLSVAMFAMLSLVSLGSLAGARSRLVGSSGAWRAKGDSANRKSPALFFVCIAVFSIPYNYLRNADGLQAVYASAVEWPSVLAVAAVALALIALAETAAERRGILLVPGFVLCLLSAAMVTYLLARDDYAFAVPSLLYTGYYLFLAMVYLALGPIAATTDANPTRLFSSAMLANVGGLLLGSIIAGTERWFGAQGTALTVLAVTYALLVAGFLLLGSKSYSLFRVNNFDEEEYSFEYVAPVKARVVEASSEEGARQESREPSLASAIARQCATVSARYRLSGREREVLAELARARTIASIAEELVVSENTIKAHTKSIYRKLGVHTREELLHRIEESEREGKIP